eukprot:TRINITY_DN9034_c0_g1_i3.p1 TRINITY_DN9034_c0_g1~~TRINITY_DN9034_c0_g1_i3.p1  ORF type:complete len:635 (-),score=150.86 TRINITY_DN9034_c0_g1_i3:281-2185(-)
MQSVRSNNFHLHKSKIMSGSLTLPDHFEVVVLGTGITESVVAAAASRLGHSVLHIDTAGYYGGDSASFTLDGLINWADENSGNKGSSENPTENNTDKAALNELLEEGEKVVELGNEQSVHSVAYTWHQPKIETSDNQETESPPEGESCAVPDSRVPTSDQQQEDEREVNTDDTPKVEEPKHEKSKEWNKESLLEESRRFNLDLSPRLLYARGSMVELLISSNISRYTEFKSVTRVLTQIGGRLEHVPSSRSDVFATKHITVVEKRILMKFLSYCVNEKVEDILQDKEHKSFREFLAGENLTENLIHFVIHSIAMVPPTAGIRHGVMQTVKFLSSLGRFGSTPFLWSMYGTGELPQAFCRLCAVFGGVYYLGRKMSGIILKDNKCKGIITEGKRINCDFLVLPDQSVPQNMLPDDLKQVSTNRGIYISDKSVLPADKEQITLLSLPSEEPIHIIEVGPGTAACPKGLQIVHASCEEKEGEEKNDLEKVEAILPKESVRFSMKFKQSTRIGSVETKMSNVYRASGPQPELDFDSALQEAENIYGRIFPGEEFLPRAPDPEEIIIGDDNETNSEKPTSENTEAETEADTIMKEESKAENDADTKDTSDEKVIADNNENAEAPSEDTKVQPIEEKVKE